MQPEGPMAWLEEVAVARVAAVDRVLNDELCADPPAGTQQLASAQNEGVGDVDLGALRRREGRQTVDIFFGRGRAGGREREGRSG